MHFVVSYIIFYIFIFTEELVDLKKMCYCVVCSVYYYLFSFLLLFDWLSFRGRGGGISD